MKQKLKPDVDYKVPYRMVEKIMERYDKKIGLLQCIQKTLVETLNKSEKLNRLKNIKRRNRKRNI